MEQKTGIEFQKEEKIQVKQKLFVDDNDFAGCRLVYLGDDNKNGRQLGIKWLKKVINEPGSERVKIWLKNELFWIENVDALLSSSNHNE